MLLRFLKVWVNLQSSGKVKFDIWPVFLLLWRTGFPDVLPRPFQSASSDHFYFKKHKSLNNIDHSYQKKNLWVYILHFHKEIKVIFVSCVFPPTAVLRSLPSLNVNFHFSENMLICSIVPSCPQVMMNNSRLFTSREVNIPNGKAIKYSFLNINNTAKAKVISWQHFFQFLFSKLGPKFRIIKLSRCILHENHPCLGSS